MKLTNCNNKTMLLLQLQANAAMCVTVCVITNVNTLLSCNLAAAHAV